MVFQVEVTARAMEDLRLKMVQSKWMEHTDGARRGVVRKERQVP